MSDRLISVTGYFEDFEVGQKFRHARGATIGEVEGAVMSKLVMNTAQGHWNEHFSMNGGPTGRVVFGLVTGSVIFGLASQDVAEHAITELGCDGLRFHAPVKHGDTLYAYTEVLEMTPADGGGVVRFKHWGVTHDDRLVFEGERTILLECRENASLSTQLDSHASTIDRTGQPERNTV
jgi:itaconyl-CoA hydratase